MSEEQELLHKRNTTEQQQSATAASSCSSHITVEVYPHIKTKLKKVETNKWLFAKECTAYAVMYKVHNELDQAKNLYFYVQRKNGRFAMIQHGISVILVNVLLDSKLSVLHRKFKEDNGTLKIFYHNDYLGRNKFLDTCFYIAQIVVGLYLILFVYGYLKMHDYI